MHYVIQNDAVHGFHMKNLSISLSGSDNRASEIEENQPFLDRAPTLPSKQLLRSLVQTEPNDSASEHKEAKYSDPDTEKGKGC